MAGCGHDGPVVVFEGSRSACAEAALVLEAKSVPYELAPSGGVLGGADGPGRIGVRQRGACALRRRAPRGTCAAAHPRGLPGRRHRYGGVRRRSADHGVLHGHTRLRQGLVGGPDRWNARVGGAGEWWRARSRRLTLHLDQAHLARQICCSAPYSARSRAGLSAPGIAWSSILAARAVADYLDMLISPSDIERPGASTCGVRRPWGAVGLLVGD